jgi:hypothetical protein
MTGINIIFLIIAWRNLSGTFSASIVVIAVTLASPFSSVTLFAPSLAVITMRKFLFYWKMNEK